MATTPRQILEAAYAKSMKNLPGTIATESTELLQVVIRAMRGLYAFAARVNPTWFATSQDVSFAGTGWTRPGNAESIFRVEALATTVPTTPAGTEIVIVPFDDKKAETGIPALYQYGQAFYGAGNALDPTGGSLRFLYSKQPSSPANLDAALDSTWNATESFNELLVLETAIYLALKDNRGDEVPPLIMDRDRWAQLFVAFLEHEAVNLRRRWGHIRRINTQTVIPLHSLLAAGPALVSAGQKA